MEKQVYSKAYVELYELIKHLSIEEQNKIPDTYKNNLLKNMDKNYEFSIDPDKPLNEQNYMNETKALYINLYDMYLANEQEKVVLKQYHKIAHNLIEEEKISKYNIDDIFSKNDMSKNNILDGDYINDSENRKNNNYYLTNYKWAKLKTIINKVKQFFKFK